MADNVVNVPLPPGAGSERFRAAWADRIIPALEAWRPELLIISAGFDAHRADPLAELRVETEDFAWLTDRLLAVADAHAAAGSSPCWRAATTWRRWPPPPRPMSGG